MVQENPLGIVLLLFVGFLILVLRASIKALKEIRKERREELLREAEYRGYMQGVQRSQMASYRNEMESMDYLAETRKKIAKTCLQEHDLKGCRKELLALPAPQL